MKHDFLINVIDYTITDIETGVILEKGVKFVSDNEMVEDIAKKWIELGGDAEGFTYCFKQILDKIRELEQ